MAGLPYLAYFAEDESKLNDSWVYLVRAAGMAGQAIEIGGETLTKLARVASVADLPDLPIVLVSPQNADEMPGDTPLMAFVHPVDCVYLFGPSNGVLTEASLCGRIPAAKVYIPPPTDGTNLFAPQAGAIVYWDRLLKEYLSG